MKRKTTLSIALVSSIVLVSLMISHPTAMAQQQRFAVETGIVPVGPGQMLRLTVAAPGDVDGADFVAIRFRRIEYEMCQASPKLCIASQTISDPIRLAAGEGAYFDIGPDAQGVRGLVLSNDRNVNVKATIIDTATQEVVAIAHTSTTMYWP